MTQTTTERIYQAKAQVAEHSDGGRERRRASMDRIEVRAKDDGGYQFTGHAAVFDELSEELGFFASFREVIKRGAFKTVLEDDVHLLQNHNSDLVLARTASGTLTLSEDPKGLVAEADVAPTSYAADLRVLLERRDVSQMSFAFEVGEDSWYEDDESNVIRTIHKVDRLYDVSVVTYPAYPQTDANLRSVCGVCVVDERGAPDRERLTALAWRIHRRDVAASPEQRAAIDGLLTNFSTVSPWTAERTLMAVASEPELLAAVPGKRAHVELTPHAESPLWRVQANQRRLRQRQHALTP